MDRKFAEVARRHVDAIDLLIGTLAEIVREHAPEERKMQMLQGIFKGSEELYRTVSKPIADVYPDLHPDHPK